MAMRYGIVCLDFLKSYDNSFASAYIFSQPDIESRVKVDLDLKEKLRAMSPSQLNISHMLKTLVDDLKNEGFVELENDFEGRYKVMAAFNYAEELILSINIPEEIAFYWKGKLRARISRKLRRILVRCIAIRKTRGNTGIRVATLLFLLFNRI